MTSSSALPSIAPAQIDTAKVVAKYRQRVIDVERRLVLVSRLAESDQASDLTVPANCEGFGRIRHFRRHSARGWPPNPLPIDPASHALGVPLGDELEAQVFQNAACAWRCWYCFVPYNMLAADESRSKWLSADELVEFYLRDAKRPLVIDLTGGSPDLTPEWVPWMMEALMSRGLEKSVYLWSDDNLSTDLLWQLDQAQLDLIRDYRNYGRVACFKGFDGESFAFNTSATPDQYERQFDRFKRLADSKLMDLYAYVTLTAPPMADIDVRVRRFVERLRSIHPNLPLRTVPLEIQTFAPVKPRISTIRDQAINTQREAISIWQDELRRLYNAEELAIPIQEICLD